MSNYWTTVSLGEVLSKSEERIAIKPTTKYKEITVRLWGRGVVQRRIVEGLEIAASHRVVVRANQFILSRIDARHGALGLVPDSLDGAVVSTDFPVFSLNKTKMLPSFLNWLSKTQGFIDICKAASVGTTNRIRLKEEKFLAMKLPLPSLTKQQHIVARIDELAAKIEEARVLRQEAIAKANLMVKSSIRQLLLSDNFQEIQLEDACESIIDNLHRNPVYADDGVPCVRSPDVGWGKINLSTALKTSEEEYTERTVRGEPQVDDVVLVREGGGTGKAGIVEPGQRFSLGQRVMMLRPKKKVVLPQFFLYQLISPLIYDDQILPRCMGSASPHLNIGALRKFKFYIPSISQQQQIVEQIDNLQLRVNALKELQSQTAAELDAMLPAVLDKAFKGGL